MTMASPSRNKKVAPARAHSPSRRRSYALREHAAVGHPDVREGVTEALKQLNGIEEQVARLARRTVVEALGAARGAAGGLADVSRAVLTGAVDAAGESAAALRLGIQGAARGTVAGVHDTGGDLSRAVAEVVKAAILEGHRVGADLGAVARAALDGVSRGVADVGCGAASTAKHAARDAVATAQGISLLAAEAVRQVVRGTAEGLEEILERDEPPVPDGRRRRAKSVE